MRVDLKRFLFVGATSAKGYFLKTAQKTGIIQFIEDTKTENLSEWTQKYYRCDQTSERISAESYFDRGRPGK